jgi:CubicO group peptidase (beta-lactamase class C family)
MRSTYYCETAPLIPHRAHGYSSDGHGGWMNAAFIAMSQPYAAGSLCSTVRDLITWTRALQSGRVVKPASYAKMTAPIPFPDGKPQHYGFGLGVDDMDGHHMVSHGGGINGFGTKMGSYPTDSLIVVVLSSTESRVASELEKRIARRALGLADPVIP